MSSQQTIVQSSRESNKLLSRRGNITKSASDFAATTASNMQMSNPSTKAAKIQADAQEAQKPAAWVDAPLDAATISNIPDRGNQPNGKVQQACNGSATTNDSGGVAAAVSRPINVVKVSQSAPAISKGHELLGRGSRVAHGRDDQHSAYNDPLGKCSSPRPHEQRSGSDGSDGRITQEVHLRQAARAFKPKASRDTRKPHAAAKRSLSDRHDAEGFHAPVSAKRRVADARDTAYREPEKASSSPVEVDESPGLRKGFIGSGLVGGNNKEALPARTFDENREDEIIALIEDHQKERLRMDPLRELDEALMDRTTASLNRRLKETYKHLAGRHTEEPLSPTFIEIDLARPQAIRIISQAEAERHQELANRMNCDLAASEEVDVLAQDSTAGKATKQQRQQECSVTKAKRLRKHEEQRHRSDAREHGFEADSGRLLRPGVEPPEFGESSGKERYELEDIARRKSQRVRRPLFRQFDQDALDEQGQQLDQHVAEFTQKSAHGASATAEHRHGTRSKTRLGRAFDGPVTANSNSAAGQPQDYFQTSLDKTSIKLPRKRAVNQSQADEQCNAQRKVATHRGSPDELEGMCVDSAVPGAQGATKHLDDVGSGSEHFNGVFQAGRFGGGGSGQAQISLKDDPHSKKPAGADAQRRKRWLKADQKSRGDLGVLSAGGNHVDGKVWDEKVSNEFDSDEKNYKGRFQSAQSPGGGHANRDLQVTYLSPQAVDAHVAATGEDRCLQDGEQEGALDLDGSSHDIADDDLVNRMQVTHRMHDRANDGNVENSKADMIRGPQPIRGSLPLEAARGTSDSNEPASGARVFPKNDLYHEQISPLRKSLQQALIGTRPRNKTNNMLRTPKRGIGSNISGTPTSEHCGMAKAVSRLPGAKSGDTPQKLLQNNRINRYSPAAFPEGNRPNTGATCSNPRSRQLAELIAFAQKRSTADMHALSTQLLRMLPPPERTHDAKTSTETARRRAYSFGQTLRKLIALTNMISVHQMPVPVPIPYNPMPVAPLTPSAEDVADNQVEDATPAPKISLQQMLRKALGPQGTDGGPSGALLKKPKCDSQGFARPENVIRPLDAPNHGQPAPKRQRVADQ